ncbi:hypothetical protein KEJ15_00540 [Candidatus Bathyarchaeota archaeon]|nr:hypothetical protein [Candidatus Bathyarchaeota archaeon]
MNTKKMVAVMGGFLIMAGIVLLGMAALAVSGHLDVGLMLEPKYLLTFAILIVAVGLLDMFCGITLARW